MTAVIAPFAFPARADGGGVPAFVSDFYAAFVSCDPQRLDAVLHEDVVWHVPGPADQFDLFGLRRGKAAVIELITRIVPCFHILVGFEMEQILVNGERVASFGRICSHQRESGRSIRFAYAHFLKFEGGRLLKFRAIIDTFDAAEQMSGCSIMVAAGKPPAVKVPALL